MTKIFEIAPDFTTKDWVDLELSEQSSCDDWKTATQAFSGRFDNRYLSPCDHLIDVHDPDNLIAGFVVLSIDFLLLETLQAFITGTENHTGESKNLGAVLDNHKWGYHGTYEKESFKQT